MSLKHREALAQQIVDANPILGAYLRNYDPGTAVLGSWDFMSYSFQRGFEEMWDKARIDLSGLLTPPLLLLWRQSLELCLKASILEIAGELSSKPGHNLEALFKVLLGVCGARGFDYDDELTDEVHKMIRFAQSFDPAADRFRYPTGRRGDEYPGISVDFDRLYQAHWIITTWCEGAQLEINGDI